MKVQTKSTQHSTALTNSKGFEAGVSEAGLARIDDMCLTAIADEDIPGVVALVARKGKYRHVAVSPNAAGKWTNYPTTFYDPKYPITGAKQFFSGEAGFSSTAEDSAKFLQIY